MKLSKKLKPESGVTRKDHVPAAGVHEPLRRKDSASLQRLRKILENPKQRTQLVLMLACGAVALWTMITTLIIDIRAYTALPWSDHWEFWRILLADGYGLRNFFRLHNEHRIALPRLWFMIDYLWFGASGIFVLASIYLIQLGHGLLVWRIGARASGGSTLGTLAMGSLVTAALFSSQQLMNLTQPFQIQFVGVYLLATAALYALLRIEYSPESPRFSKRANGWLGLSLLLAWGATYTMSNGLILWPVLLLFALVMHLRWQHVALVAANGVTAFIVYLYGWHSPPQHISPLESLFNPPQALAFTLTYLGSPIDDTVSAICKIFSIGGDNYRWMWDSAAGLLVLIAAITIMLRALERAKSFNRAQLLLIHNLLFLVLTAIATGMGRGIQFNLGEALASRYATPTLVFWSCLLVLFWSLQMRREDTEFVQPSSNFQLGVLFAVFLLVAINQTPRLAAVRAFKSLEGEVEAAVTARVYDEPLWKRAFYDPTVMQPIVQYFWENHLSIFKPDWTRWPGRKLQDLFEVVGNDSKCIGSFDEAALVPPNSWPGFRVTGWAWDPEFKRGPGKVVFANESGVVMGVAPNVVERMDVVRAQLGVTTPDVGWQGYIPSGNFKQLNAYLIRKDGESVCKVASLQVSSDLVHANEIGSVYPNATVVLNGGWVKDGYYPAVGKPPLQPEGFGSWNGSDKNTGTISITFKAPKGTSAIALPVVTGPDPKKSSIQIANKDTGEILTSASPPPMIRQWVVLRFAFAALSKETTITVVATDDGTEFGQWLGIGQPHEVKPAR